MLKRINIIFGKKMKKIILISLGLLISFYSYPQHNEEVIKTISTVYRCHMALSANNNTSYTKPKGYIYDENGVINGQVFESLMGKNQFDTLFIIEKINNTPLKVKWGERTTELVWAEGNIKELNTINGSKVGVYQKEGSKVITFAPKRNDNTVVTYPIIVDSMGRVEEAHFYTKEPYDKYLKTGGIKKYLYENDSIIIVHNTAYKPTKEPTEKDIISVTNSRYTLGSKKTTEKKTQKKGKNLSDNFEFNQVNYYNNEHKLEEQLTFNSNDNGKHFIEKFEYLNGVKYKTMGRLLDKENQLLSSFVVIDFDNPNQSPTLKNQDQKKGRYEFDANNDLIYEQNDTYHRRKIDGIWEDWKYRHM